MFEMLALRSTRVVGLGEIPPDPLRECLSDALRDDRELAIVTAALVASISLLCRSSIS